MYTPKLSTFPSQDGLLLDIPDFQGDDEASLNNEFWTSWIDFEVCCSLLTANSNYLDSQ
jgi:hypothetical protein